MATLTLTIPDDQAPRVLAAYCALNGWRSVELDGSRAEFTRRCIRRDMVATVRGYERQTAERAALAAVSVSDVVVE